ncbi:unnamed protein product, partial [Prorocentrum cordatum]
APQAPKAPPASWACHAASPAEAGVGVAFEKAPNTQSDQKGHDAPRYDGEAFDTIVL